MVVQVSGSGQRDSVARYFRACVLPAGAAGFALAAALIWVIVAHALGAESQLISASLVGSNPILIAIALGTVFYRPGPRVAVYALLATVLTVVVQGAMVSALTPFGIPTLTASFVLVTWLFLLPGQKLDWRDGFFSESNASASPTRPRNSSCALTFNQRAIAGQLPLNYLW